MTMGQADYVTRIRDRQIEIRLKTDESAEETPAATQEAAAPEPERSREVGGV